MEKQTKLILCEDIIMVKRLALLILCCCPSILHWPVDPKDWAIHDAKSIEASVTSHVWDGDVILLHDMPDSSVEAAFEIVDALREQGFRFVTVSELARARNIVLVPGTKYSRFESTDFQEKK